MGKKHVSEVIESSELDRGQQLTAGAGMVAR